MRDHFRVDVYLACFGPAPPMKRGPARQGAHTLGLVWLGGHLFRFVANGHVPLFVFLTETRSTEDRSGSTPSRRTFPSLEDGPYRGFSKMPESRLRRRRVPIGGRPPHSVHFDTAGRVGVCALPAGPQVAVRTRVSSRTARVQRRRMPVFARMVFRGFGRPVPG